MGLLRRISPSLICAAVICILFGPWLFSHIANSLDPHLFNDDARQQIWPYLQFREPTLFASDYLAAYQRAFNPLGVDGLYRLTSVVLDPRVTSKILAYVLFFLLLVGVWAASRTLAGTIAAWASVALCLSGTSFMEFMMGGLPRSFAYPVVALAVASLVSGRVSGVVAATLAGALFYYPAAAFSGILLATFLLLPEQWGGVSRSWSYRRRILVLAAAGFATLLLAAPSFVSLREYGGAISPAMWNEFPEAGYGGRFSNSDVVARPHVTDVPRVVLHAMLEAVRGGAEPWSSTVSRHEGLWRITLVWLIAAMTMVGVTMRALHDPAARRLLVVLPALAGIFALSWLLVPELYVPGRYPTIVLPVFFVVAFPVVVVTLVKRYDGRIPPPYHLSALVALCTLIVAFPVRGGAGTDDVGYTIRVDSAELPLHDFLSALPSGVLIAGWPSTLDNVPYLSGRSAFLTRELHLPFHVNFAAEARTRMHAIIDAYMSSDAGPLQSLRDDHGVTHLVVDFRHFRDEAPRYFSPYDELARDAFHGMGNTSEVMRQLETSAVFRDENYAVLELSSLRS